MQSRIDNLERNRRREEQDNLEGNDEEEVNEIADQEQRTNDIEDPEEKRFVRLLKEVQGSGGKSHIDFPIYQGKMDSEEVLGWLDALDNYFEFEEMEEERKVKFAKTKLRGTALTWWTSFWNDRMARGLAKVSTWSRMKSLMKEQFLPSDYTIHVKRMRQNLKQKEMDVMAYIEQSHKLSIRGGYEEEDEKVEGTGCWMGIGSGGDGDAGMQFCMGILLQGVGEGFLGGGDGGGDDRGGGGRVGGGGDKGGGGRGGLILGAGGGVRIGVVLIVVGGMEDDRRPT
ncbi:uncharacterized protein LOC131860256 [Cryptomeria japonica]|uniref:uncharacterized protein LOC131860256 n=1 Tax=Cryptomeria japonica TaxID=3369 RepID=UPI0027DA088E|nr:uncharacterized protein LOC131860256 [Cryptomeria japonica]